MRATDKQRGFTLLEIMVVITRQPGGSQPDGQ